MNKFEVIDNINDIPEIESVKIMRQWPDKIVITVSEKAAVAKVAFYGYFINENGVRTPAPLVVNVFEYGSSKFAKRPFFRRSFKKSQIESAMLKAQKELSGGLLDE